MASTLFQGVVNGEGKPPNLDTLRRHLTLGTTDTSKLASWVPGIS